MKQKTQTAAVERKSEARRWDLRFLGGRRVSWGFEEF